MNKGFDLKGSNTSKTKFDELKSKGIAPFTIDINQRGKDISDFLVADILIVAITSKNVDDFENLIKQIEQTRLRKIIFISSTSIYKNSNGVVKEESPINKAALYEIETLFGKNADLQTTILRFGGLFGYDREAGNFIKGDKKIENPEGFINLIHRDDCIQIIEKIIQYNIWNRTLNACADSHPKRREFYKKEFKKLEKPEPEFNEKSLNAYKIVNSKKLKSLLDYKFKYSDLMNY
jgi:nucleoside-diphosphate-sugar epimerase